MIDCIKNIFFVALLDQVWSKTNTESLNLSYLILLKYHFHGDKSTPYSIEDNT